MNIVIHQNANGRYMGYVDGTLISAEGNSLSEVTRRLEREIERTRNVNERYFIETFVGSDPLPTEDFELLKLDLDPELIREFTNKAKETGVSVNSLIVSYIETLTKILEK